MSYAAYYQGAMQLPKVTFESPSRFKSLVRSGAMLRGVGKPKHLTIELTDSPDIF